MKLKPGHWYGWQMLPGYGNGPYFSPIRIENAPSVPGVGQTFNLAFLNAQYARGVRNFSQDLTVLFKSDSYIVAALKHPNVPATRTGIISKMTANWLRRCCPDVAGFLNLESESYPDLDKALEFWHREVTSSDYP
jgi:hypothetical protein